MLIAFGMKAARPRPAPEPQAVMHMISENEEDHKFSILKNEDFSCFFILSIILSTILSALSTPLD